MKLGELRLLYWVTWSCGRLLNDCIIEWRTTYIWNGSSFFFLKKIGCNNQLINQFLCGHRLVEETKKSICLCVCACVYNKIFPGVKSLDDSSAGFSWLTCRCSHKLNLYIFMHLFAWPWLYITFILYVYMPPILIRSCNQHRNICVG